MILSSSVGAPKIWQRSFSTMRGGLTVACKVISSTCGIRTCKTRRTKTRRATSRCTTTSMSRGGAIPKDCLPPASPMSKPLVTLYVVVHGEAYERYRTQLVRDAVEFWFPASTSAEIVTLPGRSNGGGRDWSYTSSTRYRVALDNIDKIRGKYI